MSAEDFDQEFEPFYDFSGTYEEDYQGKTLDDFDLTEEPIARADEMREKADVPETIPEEPESIPEKPEGEDDDWEDVDMEDESKGSSSF
jgi:hypothetical protein